MLNCYIYRTDGHYVNQCSAKDKGKESVLNMVTAKHKSVTTHNRAKNSEWEVQEAIQKAATEWVEKANNNNVVGGYKRVVC